MQGYLEFTSASELRVHYAALKRRTASRPVVLPLPPLIVLRQIEVKRDVIEVASPVVAVVPV